MNGNSNKFSLSTWTWREIKLSQLGLYTRLKMKKEDPCPHNFKCTNCKGEHQADSYECLFWKHRFNRQWYSKKVQEL